MAYFTRIYRNDRMCIGFDCADENWLFVRKEPGGIFIDKAYMTKEPILTIPQAIKFAKKILELCK